MDGKWKKKCEEFLRLKCKDDVLELSTIYPDKRSIFVNYDELEKHDPEMADALINDPEEMLKEFDLALSNVDIPLLIKMKDVHVRFVNIPNRIPIRDLRSKNLTSFVAVEGMIRRTTDVRPRVTKAAFLCMRCDTMTWIEQPGSKLDEPYSGCENENCGKRGPFKFIPQQSEFIDSQKAQIQESPESLKGGSNPQSIEIGFSDDLTGFVFPGDRVIINGVLKSVQRPVREGKSTYYDLILEANSIERLDQEFNELEISAEDEAEIIKLSQCPDIYDKIVQSIAPTIYGNEWVKKAVMYQLFSGMVKEFPDGTRTRGDIHVILVGDPGVAKSQLLRYVVKLSPRGVFTSGKSASASGLTASAVRDELGDGRWTIEGGALVMADMGIAAIDEMDKMKDDDKSSLHEAMEQQTISLAKAGIVATLKTRCALLGAANPSYGRFDKFESLASQINMPPTLLSRFDLIFLLLDTPNNENDERIAKHLIKTHFAGQLVQHKKNVANADISQSFIEEQLSNIQPEIDPELLRKYIAYSRKNIFPIMMEEAAQNHLTGFYLNLRKQGEVKNSPVPVTARQMEALVRLSEASARVRLSNAITIDDARRATDITMECLKNVGIDPQTGMLDADIIEAGIPKSQRDKIKTIKEIIHSIAVRNVNARAPLSDVYRECEEKLKLSQSDVDVFIEKMNQKGEILKPDSNHVKLIYG